MMTVTSRLKFALWFSLLVAAGCSADLPQAPTNQLIKGSFAITAEWKIIKLDSPLRTLPHIQRLEILLDTDKYKPISDIGLGEYDIIGDSYRSNIGSTPIRAEVIFIDNKGYEYRATKKSVGFGSVKGKEYYFLAYGTNSNKGKFYFDEDAEFIAIKIKANIKFDIEHLFWRSPYFYQAPNESWDDISKSEILYLPN